MGDINVSVGEVNSVWETLTQCGRGNQGFHSKNDYKYSYSNHAVVISVAAE